MATNLEGDNEVSAELKTESKEDQWQKTDREVYETSTHIHDVEEEAN